MVAGRIGLRGLRVRSHAEWQSKHDDALAAIQNRRMVVVCASVQTVPSCTVATFHLVQSQSSLRWMAHGDRGARGVNALRFAAVASGLDDANAMTQCQLTVEWTALGAIWITRYATLSHATK